MASLWNVRFIAIILHIRCPSGSAITPTLSSSLNRRYSAQTVKLFNDFVQDPFAWQQRRSLGVLQLFDLQSMHVVFFIAPSILFRLTVYIPSHLPTSLIFIWKTSLKWHLCEMSGSLLSFFISDVQVDPLLPLLCLLRWTADIPLRLWSSSMILFKTRLLDSNVGRWVCCNYLTYKVCMWICYCTIHLVPQTVYIPSHLPTSLIFIWKSSIKWHLREMSGSLLSFFISDVQVDPRLPLLCLLRWTADIPLRLWSSSMILFKTRLLDTNVGRWMCCNYLSSLNSRYSAQTLKLFNDFIQDTFAWQQRRSLGVLQLFELQSMHVDLLLHRPPCSVKLFTSHLTCQLL